MWDVVTGLRESGVTIILTTHYIEEAEQMADRVGIINDGEIILVQEKTSLMRELGKKQLFLHLHESLDDVPSQLSSYKLAISDDGRELVYTYDTKEEHTGITALLGELQASGIRFNDLNTSQSSLQDIFVDLVRRPQ